jgi:hypothetical protein
LDLDGGGVGGGSRAVARVIRRDPSPLYRSTQVLNQYRVRDPLSVRVLRFVLHVAMWFPDATHSKQFMC